jgi:hypothetical protein
MHYQVALCLLFSLCGCTEKDRGPHPAEGEGEHELDPGPFGHPPGGEGSEADNGGEDSSGGEGPGEGEDPGADEDTGGADTAEPPPTGATVCYPGPEEDYTACFPIVSSDEVTGPDYGYPEPFEGNPQYNAPSGYLDLRVSDHETGLSPNFVFSEFMSEAKGPYGLFQVHVVESLQALREASGGPLYINSGYRNVTYNESVGGVTWSRHIYGDAVDMYSDTLSIDELADACADIGADFTKTYSTHVHCDWRDHELDIAFFD